jgi:hypothetical protein
MATKTAKKEAITATTPTGRLINESMFEKDAYVDPRTQKEGKAAYKIEMAFEPNDVQGSDASPNDFEERICDAIEAEWGPAAVDAFMNGDIKCFLDGDKLARKREEKQKEGTAYKGKLVLRANTIYSKNGVDGPGGIEVWTPDLKPIDFSNRDQIYPGVYIQAAVTINCYEDRDGDKCVGFYLNGVQKIKDGEPLVQKKSSAGAFKPVGRVDGAATTRSRRAG